MGNVFGDAGTKSGKGDGKGDAGLESVMGDVISDAGAKPETRDVTGKHAQLQYSFKNRDPWRQHCSHTRLTALQIVTAVTAI